MQRQIASQLLQRAPRESPFCLRLTHVRPGRQNVDENLPKSESSNRKSAIASVRLVRRLINHRGRASPREHREKKVNLAPPAEARPLKGSLLLSVFEQKTERGN